MQNRMVLDRGGNYVVTGSPHPEGDALERRVVRLGATAGENDLAHSSSESARYYFAGVIDGLPGLLGDGVEAGWIAKYAREVGQHGRQDFFANRRCRGVVQIDQLFGD